MYLSAILLVLLSAGIAQDIEHEKDDNADKLEALLQNTYILAAACGDTTVTSSHNEKLSELEELLRQHQTYISKIQNTMLVESALQRKSIMEIKETLESQKEKHNKMELQYKLMEETVQAIISNYTEGEEAAAEMRQSVEKLINSIQQLAIKLQSDLQEQIKATLQQLLKPECASGWELFEGNCYFFSKEMKSWYASEEFCQQHGAHLSSIHSEAENAFIVDHGFPQYDVHQDWYWIGLKTLSSSKKFDRWADGSKIVYGKWLEGQPAYDSGEYSCVWVTADTYAIEHRALWNDITCGHDSFYVCKKPLKTNFFAG